MITMRAHLLLLLLLAVATAPLTLTALSPEELAPEKKISGVNPGIYAAEQQKPAPAANVEKETPKIVAGTKSNVMGGGAIGGGLNYAGGEKKPEGKSDDAVKKPMENPEAKVIPGVKAAEKSNVYENAVTSEKKAIDAMKKSKIKSEEAEEKKFKIKSESFGYDNTEKKTKNKSDNMEEAKDKKKPKNESDDIEDAKAKKKPKNVSDDIEDAEAKKKPKNKSDDIEDSEAKKKPRNKSGDIEDAEAKKKPESKSDSYEDAGAEKKEKKSKSKEDDSSEDTKTKKSKSKSEAYEDGSTKKKSKKKKSGSSSEDDFDAIPMETPADESTPAADTPDGYQAPTTQTMAATDSPDGYVPASDSPDRNVPASDSPDGYVPATDSPDGEVPASDSPDGYDASTEKPSSNKVDVQSFDDIAVPVPEPVLKMLSPLIKAQCAKTEYPSVCQTSIAKLPFIPPVLDSVGVLKLAMDAVRARIQEAKNDALEVAKEPGTSKLAQGAISDCLQLYDDISYSYDNALAALKRGDKASAVAAVDGARTDVDTCDNGFRQSSKGKPPLAGQEKLLAKLSSNVLCMNRNLKLY